MAILKTKILSGPVSGTLGINPDIAVYKGIPFAAPPTGDLRWAAPQPVPEWTGTRVCDTFPDACPQTDFDPDSFYYKEFYHALAKLPMSEDCLYLNVWTPARTTDEKLPVMFWIHGGGFVHGAGHEFPFDGEKLAERGVILVTVNYRLGALAFMAHPELSESSPDGVSGNYGILDQIAAFQWTRDNISAFGGDPDKITIFGQSAGALSVHILVTSPPMAAVAGAITQSGGGLNTFGRLRHLADAERIGQEFMENAGWTSIADMRAQPMDRIFAAVAKFAKDKPEYGRHFRPVIDGKVIPRDTTDTIMAGQAAHVPLMIGSTSDEATGLGAKREVTLQIGGSSMAMAGIWSQKTGCAAYHYHFDRKLPGRNSEFYGAFHSADLWYVFGTQDLSPRPWETMDRTLSAQMIGYWTDFAKNGDPNGGDRPSWPAYTVDQPVSMRLGEQVETFRMDKNPEFLNSKLDLLATLEKTD